MIDLAPPPWKDETERLWLRPLEEADAAHIEKL
jgi:hypothetical protein